MSGDFTPGADARMSHVRRFHAPGHVAPASRPFTRCAPRDRFALRESALACAHSCRAAHAEISSKSSMIREWLWPQTSEIMTIEPFESCGVR